jgi:hypothetical protein
MNGDTGRLSTTGAAVAYPSQDTIIENTMTSLGGSGSNTVVGGSTQSVLTQQPPTNISVTGITDYTTMNGAIGTKSPETGGGGSVAVATVTDSYQAQQQPQQQTGNDSIAGGVTSAAINTTPTAVVGQIDIGGATAAIDGGNISSGESTGSGSGGELNIPLEQLKQLLSNQLEYYFSRYVRVFYFLICINYCFVLSAKKTVTDKIYFFLLFGRKMLT